MQVRPCANAGEMRAALGPIWHYFGQNPPTGDAVKHFDRILPPERVHAAFEGEKGVAGSGSFAFDLTVPGGKVKAAGLTVVGVLPTHRRRGLLRAMMRSQVDAARERGEAAAVLWATEDTIYGQFGYGIASVAAEIDVPREHAISFRQAEIPTEVRLVSLAEAEPLIAPIYGRVARETPGMFARTSAWWQDRLLIDHPWWRQGGGG
jgi:predicted acetyltransferase